MTALLSDGSALGIQKRLVRLGKVRMGEKGSRGEPRKLSKWRLTSASRPLLEAASRLYGGTVRAWQGAPDEGMWELHTTSDSIDIMVPPSMQAYSQYYEDWSGGTCNVRCDGRYDSINERDCDHDHVDGKTPSGNPWKITTRVSVILPKLPGLGTWTLETKGWNAAATLPATLELIGATGTWIPAVMRLEQRSSRERDDKGKVMTHRFVVPVLDLAGASFEQLVAGGASDAYDAPALGAGPGSLALPPGPSRPAASARVPRPDMAPEVELDDETAPFGGPLERPFPEAPAFDEEAGPFAPPAAAAEPAAPVDFATAIRSAAADSDLTGRASQPAVSALLNGPFAGWDVGLVQAGIRALWGDEAVDRPSAAQVRALQLVGEGMPADELAAAWKTLVVEEIAAGLPS